MKFKEGHDPHKMGEVIIGSFFDYFKVHADVEETEDDEDNENIREIETDGEVTSFIVNTVLTHCVEYYDNTYNNLE